MTAEAFDTKTGPYSILCYGADQIPVLWSSLNELLAVSEPRWYGYQTPEETQEALLSGRLQYRVLECEGEPIFHMLTELLVYPRKRLFHVTWGAGELGKAAVVSLVDLLEMLAREFNCSELYVTGRRGWERLLVSTGFKFAAVQLTRPIHKRNLH